MITCASRVLNNAEINYCVSEKEILAIVWSLERFKTCVSGCKIKIFSDHKALSFLNTCKYLNSRLIRWSLYLQNYDLEINYIRGKDNYISDTLSRLKYTDELNVNTEIQQDQSFKILTLLAKDPSNDLKNKLKNIKNLQKEDSKLNNINNKLESNILRKNYEMINNILHRNKKIIVPKSLIKQLVIECHEIYGHVGSLKTFKVLSESFVFSKMRATVSKILSCCDSCQHNKVYTRGSFAPLRNIVPERPNDLLSVDFIGPLPQSTGGVRYLFTTIDAFSKFVVIYSIKKENGRIVLNKLMNDYIVKYGKPRRLLMDHGSMFTSPRFLDSLKSLGIQPVFSSVRHPCSNLVERIHREIHRFFRSLIKSKHTEWVKWVPVVQNCLNEVYHSITEFTPLEIHLIKSLRGFGISC